MVLFTASGYCPAALTISSSLVVFFVYNKGICFRLRTTPLLVHVLKTNPAFRLQYPPVSARQRNKIPLLRGAKKFYARRRLRQAAVYF